MHHEICLHGPSWGVRLYRVPLLHLMLEEEGDTRRRQHAMTRTFHSKSFGPYRDNLLISSMSSRRCVVGGERRRRGKHTRKAIGSGRTRNIGRKTMTGRTEQEEKKERKTDGQDRLTDIRKPGNPAPQSREPAPGNTHTQTAPGIRSEKIRHSPEQAQGTSEAATSAEGPNEVVIGRSQPHRLRSVRSIVQGPRQPAPALGHATEAPLVAFIPQIPRTVQHSIIYKFTP